MRSLSLNLKNDDSELRCEEEEIDLSERKNSEEESSQAKMGPTNDSSELSSPKNYSVELETNEKVEEIIINN